MRSLIDRLVAARIGRTTNFYRDGAGAALRRDRLAAYLEQRAGAPILLVGEAPGYRGARDLGPPVHLRAAADRVRPGRGDRHDRAPRARRARARPSSVLLWNVVPTHPGTETTNRAPSRAEVTAGSAFAFELARGRRLIAVGRIAAETLGGAVRPASVARRRARLRRRPGCSNRMMSPVRRNALLLALGLVFQSGMIQLAVALGTVTIVAVTGVEGILGLGPAVFLLAGAAAVGPAGRISDRVGRMPVIRTGFVLGIGGPVVTAAGCALESGVLVFLGLALCGAAQSIVLLSRAAAAEMFPPERRARGMSIVLFGVVSGAIWGPLVFGPMFAGRALTPHDLVVPWLAAGVFTLVGLADLVRRPARPEGALAGAGRAGRAGSARRAAARDPAPPGRGDGDGGRGRQLRGDGRRDEPRGLRRGRAPPRAGLDLHDHQPPHRRHVRPRARCRRRDRPHRPPHVDGRRPLRDGACRTPGWSGSDSIAGMSLSLFGLGLGWCLAYVAATTELVDLAGASERGRLIGTTDLLSSRQRRAARARGRRRLHRGGRLGAARAQRLRPGGLRGRLGGRKPARLRHSCRERPLLTAATIPARPTSWWALFSV